MYTTIWNFEVSSQPLLFVYIQWGTPSFSELEWNETFHIIKIFMIQLDFYAPMLNTVQWQQQPSWISNQHQNCNLDHPILYSCRVWFQSSSTIYILLLHLYVWPLSWISNWQKNKTCSHIVNISTKLKCYYTCGCLE